MWLVPWEERGHRCRARLVYSERAGDLGGDLRTMGRVSGERDGFAVGSTHTVRHFAQGRPR